MSITSDANREATTTTYSILPAINFCHLLDDMLQSLLPERIGTDAGLFLGLALGRSVQLCSVSGRCDEDH